MTDYIKLKNKIKKNEGFKNNAYFDQLGFITIGFGHLIKKSEDYLLNNKQTKKNLIKIFNLDFNRALKDYNINYRKYNFSKKIEYILIEMIFQLGIKKQKKFKRMIKSLIEKKIYMACLEMKKSLWYQQTPKRVNGLIKSLIG